MASFDFNRKICFIHVPKTAGTYLQFIFYKYYGMHAYNFCTPDYRKSSLSYKGVGLTEFYNNPNFLEIIGETQESFKDFRKFASIRNPYTRFISGWKFMIQNGLIDKDVSLRELIINREKYSDIVYNHIFLTQTEHLKCWEFDYFIKTETIEEDLNFLFKLYDIEICHIPEPKNVTESYGDPMIHYNDTFILDFVNNWFYDDFINYGYPILPIK